MELFPAIDVRAGKCVRLVQGDYARETVYGDDPVAVAQSFVDAGAVWVHTVDLDAARTGDPVNRPVIGAIAQVVGSAGGRVQAGGGVRDLASVDALLSAGVARVVIGTAAVEDPTFVAAAAAAYPGAIAVGLDARLRADGSYEVAVRGWTEGTGVELFELLSRFEDLGVAATVITEIGRDGMLSGPDLEGLRAALATTTIDVIASGGVGSILDLHALRALTVDGRTLAGAIAGKAIYEGRFTAGEGVRACRGD